MRQRSDLVCCGKPAAASWEPIVGRGMQRWCNVQAYFADLRYRPLAGLQQFLLAPVGARRTIGVITQSL